MNKTDDKIKQALNEFTKEQLVSMIRKFIKKKQIKEEIIKFIEQNQAQFRSINEKDVSLAKFSELWEEADDIIDDSNSYGGCSYDDEETAYNNLEKISELFQQGNLDKETKRQFIIECIEYYHKGNSGFDDALIETVFDICDNQDDWLFVISLLKKGQSSREYTKELIIGIYRDKLNDDKAYLNERMNKLRYGLDYFDLVKFYLGKGEMDKAQQTALEGIKKGEGRIIDLIEFMQDYYEKQGDHGNILKYMRLAFEESPSLDHYKSIKKFCNKEEWIEISKKLYGHIKEKPWIKAEVDYFNGDYSLVLEYAKRVYNGMDVWGKKLEKHFPEEVIKKYNDAAVLIIERKIAKKYPVAANYCKAIKKIYLEILNDPKRWSEYLSALKAKYTNLPSLQAQLEKL